VDYTKKAKKIQSKTRAPWEVHPFLTIGIADLNWLVESISSLEKENKSLREGTKRNEVGVNLYEIDIKGTKYTLGHEKRFTPLGIKEMVDRATYELKWSGIERTYGNEVNYLVDYFGFSTQVDNRVEVTKEAAWYIRNGRKYYKYDANVLAYAVLSIDEDLSVSDIEKLTTAVYEGYTVTGEDA
jgi:hypothetical protein